MNTFHIDDLTGKWDYRTLPPNVRIGRDCYIQHRESFSRFRSQRDPGCVLGDRVVIYNWTAFSVEPQGFIEIGDDTTLAGAIFWCNDRISIGRRCAISYNVMLADSDFHPRDPELRRADAIAISPSGDVSSRPTVVNRPVVIGDDVFVGIGAIILKGVTIGDGARIGAGAVVSRDVAPGAVVVGNPARTIEHGE